MDVLFYHDEARLSMTIMIEIDELLLYIYIELFQAFNLFTAFYAIIKNRARSQNSFLCSHARLHLFKVGLNDEFEFYFGLAHFFAVIPSFFKKFYISFKIGDIGERVFILDIIKRHKFGERNEALAVYFIPQFTLLSHFWQHFEEDQVHRRGVNFIVSDLFIELGHVPLLFSLLTPTNLIPLNRLNFLLPLSIFFLYLLFLYLHDI
jgi:hypothetical protein